MRNGKFFFKWEVVYLAVLTRPQAPHSLPPKMILSHLGQNLNSSLWYWELVIWIIPPVVRCFQGHTQVSSEVSGINLRSNIGNANTLTTVLSLQFQNVDTFKKTSQLKLQPIYHMKFIQKMFTNASSSTPFCLNIQDARQFKNFIQEFIQSPSLNCDLRKTIACSMSQLNHFYTSPKVVDFTVDGQQIWPFMT